MRMPETREEARRLLKVYMGSRVTETPDGKLTGSMDAEGAILWFEFCLAMSLGRLRREWEREFERTYQPLDQLSLKELEELAARLNAIIAEAKSKQ